MAIEQVQPEVIDEHDGIWRQMPGEPDLWYKRFRAYCFEPSHKRSIRKIALQERISDSVYEQPGIIWYDKAKEWKWEQRAKAWDRHVAIVEEQEHMEARRNVIRMQHQMVEELSKKTLYRLQDMSPEEMYDPDVVIRAFNSVIKSGSLVIGLPSERVENSGEVEFTIRLGERQLGDGDSE